MDCKQQDNEIVGWFMRAAFTFGDEHKGKHYDFPMVDPSYAMDHFQTNGGGYDFMSFPLLMQLDHENKLVITRSFDAFSYIKVDLFGDEKLKRATLLVEGTPMKVVEFAGDDVDTFRFCDSPLTIDPFCKEPVIEIEFFNDWHLGGQRRVMVGAFMASTNVRFEMARAWWNEIDHLCGYNHVNGE